MLQHPVNLYFLYSTQTLVPAEHLYSTLQTELYCIPDQLDFCLILDLSGSDVLYSTVKAKLS